MGEALVAVASQRTGSFTASSFVFGRYLNGMYLFEGDSWIGDDPMEENDDFWFRIGTSQCNNNHYCFRSNAALVPPADEGDDDNKEEGVTSGFFCFFLEVS